MTVRIRIATVCVFLLLAVLATNCSAAAVQNTGTVNPKPSIITLDASPAEVAKGNATTLSWSVSGAAKVAFDQNIGDVPTAGKISVTPDATTTYSLTASNSIGSVTQSITVKVNPSVPVGQSSPKSGNTDNAAGPALQSQAFCRDGACTYFCGKLYLIDYPDSWKASALDPNKIGLFPKDAYSAAIEIETSDPIGSVPLKQVADRYVKDFLSRGNNSFYVGDNEALTGSPWDWYIDTSFSIGLIQHVRVYYKNTDSHLYRLRAFATQNAYQATNPFTSDYDKIINSFKLQQ
jgi:hypothetical protein